MEIVVDHMPYSIIKYMISIAVIFSDFSEPQHKMVMIRYNDKFS